MKFCTRCGTNLALVTQALTGKGGNVQPEDWTEKLLKKYYAGRRDTVTGVGLIAGGLLILSLLVALGMKPMGAFWVLCWMFFWGVIAVADGLGKWLASAGEMKKIGYPVPQGNLKKETLGSRPTEERPALPADEQASMPFQYPDRKGAVSTDPISFPGSVTEQTTRNLEEHSYKPHRESESKQTG